MPVLRRRGFTLVELMVGLLLLGIISVGIYRVLVKNQQLYQTNAQKVDVGQNLRAAAAVLPAELREVDAADGDIIAMGADSIRIRAYRVFAISCTAPVLGGALTGLTLTVRQAMTYGVRNFQNGDSILVFYEGNSSTRTDDTWALGVLTSAPTTTTCPSDLKAAYTMTVSLKAGAWTNAAGNMVAGAPVRAFETTTYRNVQASDGNYYLSIRNSGGLNPLVGPLTSTGLAFAYYDSTGAVTSTAANVKRIRIALSYQSAAQVRQANGTLDNIRQSDTLQVTLRNNARAQGS
ncbi:MAG TPA: prepilin-type N-terminal cleavage/methylation domain-containing protein [Gemmatimonadales bacterium]|nr:prepilin-type N-terminal cleavage/methylation domain-containing protein [Gemmatimonadales bacterium]